MADVGVAAGLPQDLGLASQIALGFAMPSVAHVSLILASYRNKGQVRRLLVDLPCPIYPNQT